MRAHPLLALSLFPLFPVFLGVVAGCGPTIDDGAVAAARPSSTSQALLARVQGRDGVERLLVSATALGQPVRLVLDTASSTSSLSASVGVADVSIGAERRTLAIDPAGHTFDVGDGGAPVVGVLGLDFFLEVPAEIDLPAGRVLRHLDGRVPAELADAPFFTLSISEAGHAIVDVEVDGEHRALLLDTGATDTVLFDASVSAGEPLRSVRFADGASWQVADGDGMIEVPGDKIRSVPVLRAVDVAAHDATASAVRAAGADGVIGRSALGARRLVFDVDNGRLLLGPRASTPSTP